MHFGTAEADFTAIFARRFVDNRAAKAPNR
jgi:hypothetical protein